MAPELTSSLLPKLPMGKLLKTLCTAVLGAGPLWVSMSRTPGHPQGCCGWEVPLHSVTELMHLESKLFPGSENTARFISLFVLESASGRRKLLEPQVWRPFQLPHSSLFPGSIPATQVTWSAWGVVSFCTQNPTDSSCGGPTAQAGPQHRIPMSRGVDFCSRDCVAPASIFWGAGATSVCQTRP